MSERLNLLLPVRKSNFDFMFLIYFHPLLCHYIEFRLLSDKNSIVSEKNYMKLLRCKLYKPVCIDINNIDE